MFILLLQIAINVTNYSIRITSNMSNTLLSCNTSNTTGASWLCYILGFIDKTLLVFQHQSNIITVSSARVELYRPLLLLLHEIRRDSRKKYLTTFTGNVHKVYINENKASNIHNVIRKIKADILFRWDGSNMAHLNHCLIDFCIFYKQ